METCGLKASSHVLSVEGVRLKTALQSLMYQKSLRLSASGHQQVNDDVNDDDDVQLDAGSFSQLLTEDCANVMVSLSLSLILGFKQIISIYRSD